MHISIYLFLVHLKKIDPAKIKFKYTKYAPIAFRYPFNEGLECGEQPLDVWGPKSTETAPLGNNALSTYQVTSIWSKMRAIQFGVSFDFVY